MKTTYLFLFLLISVSGVSQQKPGSDKNIGAKLEAAIPTLMKEANIPGLAIALIRDNKIVWTHYFGYINSKDQTPVTENTIFEAASLTKVVTTYAILKLVDNGKLSLDVPLTYYIGNNYEVGDDPRIQKITARMVLSHTSGFPNWRGDSKLLPINFTPGEKFNYSGEGFVYLSRVAEKLTGQKFEEYVKQTVFQPLGMNSSSFIWIDAYEKNAAYRHDVFGIPTFRNQNNESNAAASMRTTAEDYAKFITALMDGKGLRKKTLKEMLSPQVNVDTKAPEVFWGLGIGLEVRKDGRSFWHWGDQGATKAWFIGNMDDKNAVIYFANSSNGLSIVQEIVDEAIGGSHPSIDWNGYDQYNSSPKLFLKSVAAYGAVEALKIYHENLQTNKVARITEDQFNNIGYQLISAKHPDDALTVFTQNTIDYPESSNTWDSLAECYLNKGDKEMAIRYYEKAFQLNPNDDIKEKLKKLKE